MIELYQTIQLIQPYLTRALHFLFGEPHKVMAISYTLLVANGLAGAVIKRRQGEEPVRRLPVRPKSTFWEKVFAYTVFISLGNMMDLLMMDELTGWEGSSQFLVCLDIIRREAKSLMELLEKNYGIVMPILNSRLDALEQQQRGTAPVPVEENLDRQLQELKDEIAAMREAERRRTEGTQEE